MEFATEAFTPIASTVGGVLIGLSAALLLLFHGRIAGISGIFGGILAPAGSDIAWRYSFTAGLLVAGFVTSMVLPSAFVFGLERSTPAVLAAGFIVGVGTYLGSGCTSGHGVCGVSRASPRSIVATLTFMATGAITAAFITRALGGVL